ncbi:uncharacterized protein [Miscanthus floridulus]|uniref:uncharacterized protein n=1 Tax=Miscanthus floridulus TaxID=154761 RepID=UPI00345A3702
MPPVETKARLKRGRRWRTWRRALQPTTGNGARARRRGAGLGEGAAAAARRGEGAGSAVGAAETTRRGEGAVARGGEARARARRGAAARGRRCLGAGAEAAVAWARRWHWQGEGDRGRRERSGASLDISELGARVTGAELGAKIYGAELGASHSGAEPPGRHAQELGASDGGAKLGTIHPGAEPRVHFRDSFRQGSICEKLSKKGQIVKNSALPSIPHFSSQRPSSPGSTAAGVLCLLPGASPRASMATSTKPRRRAAPAPVPLSLDPPAQPLRLDPPEGKARALPAAAPPAAGARAAAGASSAGRGSAGRGSELRAAWGQSRRCLRVIEEARAGRRGRWQLGAMACASVGCFVASSVGASSALLGARAADASASSRKQGPGAVAAGSLGPWLAPPSAASSPRPSTASRASPALAHLSLLRRLLPLSSKQSSLPAL